MTMPTFVYEALNEAGQPRKGEVSAVNSEQAIAKIRSRGYFPSSVREQKPKRKRSRAAKTATSKPGTEAKSWGQISITIGGIGSKALTAFTRQMSTLQDAGLPILRSLDILEQQQKPGLLKNILREVSEDVSGGTTLSDAMAKHPKAFDKLYTKLIAAGEVGGVLDQILNRLADFLEKSARLRRRVVGAMIYPTVVLSVAVLIVLGIMMYIVPKFVKIFEDFQTDLPQLTTSLIDTSRWIGGIHRPDQIIPGFVYIVAAPIFAFFGSKLIRRTELGRSIIDTVLLKVPVIGPLISKTSIARFTRTLGTLIGAGVPILDAILITRDTTNNHVYQQALDQVHDSVRQGETFGDPLRASKACDAIVINMIEVGEQTGDLDKMLIKVADNYDDQVDVAVGSMVSLVEPALIIALGSIVGFIVLALFLPLVTLMNSVGT